MVALGGWLACAGLRGHGLAPLALLPAAGLLMLLPAVLLTAALPRFFLGASGEAWRDQALRTLRRRGGSTVLHSYL